MFLHFQETVKLRLVSGCVYTWNPPPPQSPHTGPIRAEALRIPTAASVALMHTGGG